MLGRCSVEHPIPLRIGYLGFDVPTLEEQAFTLFGKQGFGIGKELLE